jgi:hypothetical protein
MSKVKIAFAMFILLFIVASGVLLTVKPVSGQEVTKPTVPEFSAKYVDYSYDVPAIYGTDPYTGNTVVTKQKEHIDNRTVEIKIQNMPFTPFNDSNRNTINLFFDVRYRGSYGGNWTTMFGNQTQGIWVGQTNPYIKYGYAVQDYSAQYTIISYQLTWQVPINGRMDFQVEALEGYTAETFHDGHILFAAVGFTFYGQESGWSNTQTVFLGEDEDYSSTPILEPSTVSTPTDTPNNPTAAPSTNDNKLQTSVSPAASIPMAIFLLVVVVFVIIISMLSLLLYRKTWRVSKQQTKAA